MDYLHLKNTLLAVFDHFLSCHDIAELEEMMQAFEAGKKLVIKLLEIVNRDDYAEDSINMMKAAIPTKVISRVKQKKTKVTIKQNIKHIKICDIPVFLDLTQLSQDKKESLNNTLKTEHNITFSDIMMDDHRGFAKARIFKVVKSDHSFFHKANNILSYDGLSVDEHTASNNLHKARGNYRKKIIENIILAIQKHRYPP